MRLGKLTATLCAALAVLCLHASADEFVTEAGYLRVKIDGHGYRLESLVIKRADATGRLPVALVTHGTADSPAQRLNQHPDSIEPQARDFAARGYLAVAVMRRGFGSSDGPIPASSGCPVKSYVERFNADADDLEGALKAVSERPDADPNHAIAVGVSAGGPAVIALSARNPAGLDGVVSISGGPVSLSCPKREALIDAYRTFAEKSRVPQLWVYARNDSLFGPSLVEKLHDAALDAGADVKLVNFGAMGIDGHDIFVAPDARLSWLGEVDGFLRAHALLTWSYAEVDRLMRALRLQETDRTFVESYLTAPTVKAMARSLDGSRRRYFFNSNDQEGVRASALRACARANDPCEIVMDNNSVVAAWTAPPHRRPSQVATASTDRPKPEADLTGGP